MGGLTPSPRKMSWLPLNATRHRNRHRGVPAVLRAIYLNGVPAEGLLACQTCCGSPAEDNGEAPRLAGQNKSYVLGELHELWSNR